MDNPYYTYCHLDQLQELTTDLPDDALRLVAVLHAPSPLFAVVPAACPWWLAGLNGSGAYAGPLANPDLLQKCRLPGNFQRQPFGRPVLPLPTMSCRIWRAGSVLSLILCLWGWNPRFDLTTAAPRSCGGQLPGSSGLCSG